MSLYYAEEPEGNSHRSHSPTKNIINPAWATDNITDLHIGPAWTFMSWISNYFE